VRTIMTAGIGALLSAVLATHTAAQWTFGAQFSLTNLGTESAQVGQTVGVGGRLGVGVGSVRSARIVVEGVGDFFFPPCDEVSCNLYGGQLNLLAFLGESASAQVYGGLGLVYERYRLENDVDDSVFKGDGFGGSLIVGLSWDVSPVFEPMLEIRLSALRDLGRQASGEVGFRLTPGA